MKERIITAAREMVTEHEKLNHLCAEYATMIENVQTGVCTDKEVIQRVTANYAQQARVTELSVHNLQNCLMMSIVKRG